MKQTLLGAFAALMFACTTPVDDNATNSDPTAPRNGEIRGSGEQTEAWSAAAGEWVPIEAFWVGYANAAPGRYWGDTDTYPPFAEVNERDTLLIRLGADGCLMEFWHRRWRRANDVRRWDPQHNDAGACPRVFD